MSDLIERSEAVDLVRKMQTYKLSADANFLLVNQAEVMTELMLLPPVKPKPKQGRWKDGKCSLCGNYALFWCMSSGYSASPYCPYCGAKMTEEEKVE